MNPTPNRTARVRRLIALVIMVLVLPAYLIWRIFYTLNPEALTFSLILLAAEIYAVVSIWNFYISTAGVENLPPDETPEPIDVSVDVFIATYNEPTDVVRRTALAARDMDLKHETWILDDGNRDEMKELAEALGVRYLARSENLHAKAGNLNNALSHSDGELILILDCDHVPQKDFLRSTVGFFADEKVAVVQTPQSFYNHDALSIWKHPFRKTVHSEQELFHQVIQPGRAKYNAAIFCGTCAVIRRKALDDVGGFAQETVTEDLHTSIRLQAKGWVVKVIRRPLAYGLCPEDFNGFAKQRNRWAVGAVQTVRAERTLFNPGLTWIQRIVHFGNLLFQFDGVPRLVLLLTPSVMLLTGMSPLQGSATTIFTVVFAYMFLIIAAVILSTNGRMDLFSILSREALSIGRIPGQLLAFRGFFKKDIKFAVTLKQKSKTEQFSFDRLFVWFIVGFIFVGMIVGPARFIMQPHLGWPALAAGLVWSGINLSIVSLLVSRLVFADANRRDETRFAAPEGWWVMTPQGVSAEIIDISGGGLGLEIPGSQPMLIEEEVTLEISNADLTMSVPSQLRWIETAEDNAVTRLGYEFVGSPVVGSSLDLESQIYPSLLRPDYEFGDGPSGLPVPARTEAADARQLVS